MTFMKPLQWLEYPNLEIRMPLPTEKGSYILIIKSCYKIKINRPKSAVLTPNFYAYTGNAKNGILRRTSYHISPKNHIRWHIDQVTKHSRIFAIIWSTQFDECSLANILRDHGVAEPIKNFGATDCKNHCYSHFFEFFGKNRCSAYFHLLN